MIKYTTALRHYGHGNVSVEMSFYTNYVSMTEFNRYNYTIRGILNASFSFPDGWEVKGTRNDSENSYIFVEAPIKTQQEAIDVMLAMALVYG